MKTSVKIKQPKKNDKSKKEQTKKPMKAIECLDARIDLLPTLSPDYLLYFLEKETMIILELQKELSKRLKGKAK